MTNTDPCLCSCHKPGIGSNGDCCDCHLAREPFDCKKAEDDALNENFEYCNDLAERINLMAKAIMALDQRVKSLESKENEQRI
jgi:hypothetical protein